MVAPAPPPPRHDEGLEAFATPANRADYDENGVDLTLVRYALSLTPTQRLKAVENFLNAIASVRPAGSTVPEPDGAK